MENKLQQFDKKLEVLPELLALLGPNQVIALKPKGSSMFPFFAGDRDTLYISGITEPVIRGDIVLYRRDSGEYVVHRVYKIKKGENELLYFMLGDHQTWIEGPLSPDHFYGVVRYYERKGKKIVCRDNSSYRLLTDIWLFLRPIRPLFLKLMSAWIHLKRLIRSRSAR